MGDEPRPAAHARLAQRQPAVRRAGRDNPSPLCSSERLAAVSRIAMPEGRGHAVKRLGRHTQSELGRPARPLYRRPWRRGRCRRGPGCRRGIDGRQRRAGRGAAARAGDLGTRDQHPGAAEPESRRSTQRIRAAAQQRRVRRPADACEAGGDTGTATGGGRERRQLRFEDGSPRSPATDTRPSLREISPRSREVAGLPRRLDPPDPKPDGVEPVTWLPLCCAVIRRSAWREIGGWDERFTFFYEDQDFCRRLAEAGWGLAIRWDAGAIHVGGGSTSTWSRANRRSGSCASSENRFLYLQKWYPRCLADLRGRLDWTRVDARRCSGMPARFARACGPTATAPAGPGVGACVPARRAAMNRVPLRRCPVRVRPPDAIGCSFTAPGSRATTTSVTRGCCRGFGASTRASWSARTVARCADSRFGP